MFDDSCHHLHQDRTDSAVQRVLTNFTPATISLGSALVRSPKSKAYSHMQREPKHFLKFAADSIVFTLILVVSTYVI